MRDFGKFCRLRDIQPTRVPQNITVYLYTVSRAKYHVLGFSEANCMSSMKYNSWLSQKRDAVSKSASNCLSMHIRLSFNSASLPRCDVP